MLAGIGTYVKFVLLYTQVEVFNVLFVKEIDKKHMVHCIECALKLNKTLKNVVVLEEFTHEELQQVYDKFVLKKVIGQSKCILVYHLKVKQVSNSNTI